MGNTERTPVRLVSMFSLTAFSRQKGTVPTPPFCHEGVPHFRVPEDRTWKCGVMEMLCITYHRRSV
jgi:hypothetical protein